MPEIALQQAFFSQVDSIYLHIRKLRPSRGDIEFAITECIVEIEARIGIQVGPNQRQRSESSIRCRSIDNEKVGTKTRYGLNELRRQGVARCFHAFDHLPGQGRVEAP